MTNSTRLLKGRKPPGCDAFREGGPCPRSPLTTAVVLAAFFVLATYADHVHMMSNSAASLSSAGAPNTVAAHDPAPLSSSDYSEHLSGSGGSSNNHAVVAAAGKSSSDRLVCFQQYHDTACTLIAGPPQCAPEGHCTHTDTFYGFEESALQYCGEEHVTVQIFDNTSSCRAEALASSTAFPIGACISLGGLYGRLSCGKLFVYSKDEEQGKDNDDDRTPFLCPCCGILAVFVSTLKHLFVFLSLFLFSF